MRRRHPLTCSAAAVALALLLISACGGPSGPGSSAATSPGSPPPGTATAPVGTGATDAPAADPPKTEPPAPKPCPDPTVVVTTAAELEAVLANARPGESIELAPGTYAGQFTATAAAGDEPVWLCGPRDAVLDGGDRAHGITVHLDGATGWHLVGFTVRGGQKGIVTDHATGIVIDGLLVEDVGDEAIHLQSSSSDNVVRRSTIRRTGHHEPQYGEGIYVGSAHNNWCRWSKCGPDRGDRNLIEGNDISETTSETIDIKEGTTGGIVRDNTLNGAGITDEVALMSAKGNDWLITGNRGIDAPRDGIQIYRATHGWGSGNRFAGNVLAVRGTGFGINTHGVPGNIVMCDNEAPGADAGLTDTTCQP